MMLMPPPSSRRQLDRRRARGRAAGARQLSMTPGAIRSRRHRKRSGREWVYLVPVNRHVLEALIDRGLPEPDSEDRKKVAAELGAVLAQWAERWFEEKS
jgi:hypothetical protein